MTLALVAAVNEMASIQNGLQFLALGFFMLATVSAYASIAANLATVLGIPLAIFLFFREKAKERLEREYGTYHALDEKYSEYLVLCMENSDLGLYAADEDGLPPLSRDQQSRQRALFEILISLLERAYLMYVDQSTYIKEKQWNGWNAYMEDWSKNKLFQKLWHELGNQYDEDFMNHINGLLGGKKI